MKHPIIIHRRAHTGSNEPGERDPLPLHGGDQILRLADVHLDQTMNDVTSMALPKNVHIGATDLRERTNFIALAFTRHGAIVVRCVEETQYPPHSDVSDLPRDAAGQGKHETHRLVSQVGGGVEHAWAAPIDYLDPMCPTVFGGLIRHAPLAKGPVHPHMLDAMVGALPHGVLGDLRPGTDQHRVHAIWDRLHIGKAGVTFDLVGVGVEGEHLIAAVTEPLTLTNLSRIAEQAGDGGRRIGRMSVVDLV